MKRLIASLRLASAPALATMVRMVWPRTMAASVAWATRRIFPLSISLSPNGGADQPTSTWSVMTWVRVADGFPVGTGVAVKLNSLMNARTTLSVDEPFVENAIVCPLVSCSVLIGDDAFAYQ